MGQETELHYNRYRYYDPHSSRYMSEDPIGLEGGLNTSAYVNNPT
ncbi:TPA: RHS repeat-associated core domain-containing protein [Acinetobacter baumannii]|jgi:RHS repeat-associated protein|nr:MULTISPECIES: RHS repeat-associated core domain-containing protein [Acinetobacter]MCZ2995836.1 RHS repeat-associated core domain-containing protein [Acinetobacter baumannii]MCZ3209344.1 RHS repeat-associated core domain-containing protein [Acinetobacter baumannii]MCZ3297154.1 RHS repeat-associated core domain-containing protein [Acinetobacter baumannii]MDA4885128.1 RHS repeat-associated core domain-containing protein [Acinetobacter baumannii]MDQ9906919.1 RHS repeat-associated core domain-co